MDVPLYSTRSAIYLAPVFFVATTGFFETVTGVFVTYVFPAGVVTVFFAAGTRGVGVTGLAGCFAYARSIKVFGFAGAVAVVNFVSGALTGLPYALSSRPVDREGNLGVPPLTDRFVLLAADAALAPRLDAPPGLPGVALLTPVERPADAALAPRFTGFALLVAGAAAAGPEALDFTGAFGRAAEGFLFAVFAVFRSAAPFAFLAAAAFASR